jgi:nucleotide-binding universal stress UspA family protein
MSEIKHILLIIRLSQYCRDALRSGIMLAKKFDAKLTVLRLVSNPVDMEAVNSPALLFKDDEHKKFLTILQEATEELDRMIRIETRGRFQLKQIVTDKDPVKEIIRVSKEDKSDLIVVLAHEEGILEHALVGRDIHKLIRKLPCSILLVKREPNRVNW